MFCYILDILQNSLLIVLTQTNALSMETFSFFFLTIKQHTKAKLMLKKKEQKKTYKGSKMTFTTILRRILKMISHISFSLFISCSINELTERSMLNREGSDIFFHKMLKMCVHSFSTYTLHKTSENSLKSNILLIHV